MDGFAPLDVWDADDRDLSYGGVGGENILDLNRIDVKATRDDHILTASDDGQIAILCLNPDVAGPVETVSKCIAGRSRVPPVFSHDLIALHEQFTRDPDRNVLSLLVDDRGDHPRNVSSNGVESTFEVVLVRQMSLRSPLLSPRSSGAGPSRKCRAPGIEALE